MRSIRPMFRRDKDSLRPCGKQAVDPVSDHFLECEVGCYYAGLQVRTLFRLI